MINETSPIAEIAVEAKDTSDDIRQISMGIEASCKHINNTVTSMKLSDVPQFIDDFPIPGIEITPGMIGYGVDTKNNEYDITHIFEKQIYNGSDNELTYDGKLTFPIDSIDMHMFFNGNIVQQSSNVLYFSDSSGNSIINITEPSVPAFSYMYHGSFYCGQSSDLYCVGIRDTIPGSKFYINLYNSSGELVSTSRIKSEYYYYHSFAFDGEHFYILSRHTTEADRFLDKYKLNGDYVGSYAFDTSAIDHINCTENYITCFYALNAVLTCVHKDLSSSFTIPRPSTNNFTISSSIPLYGLDVVVAKFGNSVAFYDLSKIISKFIDSKSGTYCSYFGSYCLYYSSVSGFQLIDLSGSVSQLKPLSLAKTFVGVSSNGKKIACKFNLEKHIYTNNATIKKACFAQKRG